MRELADLRARRARLGQRRGRARILDADDGKVACTLVCEDSTLRSRVRLMCAMPGKVIGRDVQQHGNAWMQLACRCELIARELGGEP